MSHRGTRSFKGVMAQNVGWAKPQMFSSNPAHPPSHWYQLFQARSADRVNAHSVCIAKNRFKFQIAPEKHKLSCFFLMAEHFLSTKLHTVVVSCDTFGAPSAPALSQNRTTSNQHLLLEFPCFLFSSSLNPTQPSNIACHTPYVIGNI